MTKATMPQATARVIKTIAASTGEIWKALTTRDTLKAFFFGAEVETDWQVGHAIRFKGTFKGKSYEDKGEIQRVEPRRHLSFSHWSPLAGVPDAPEHYHLVSFDLEPRGEATQVTLTQANLEGGIKESDIEHRAEYEKNWGAVLDGLDRVVGDRTMAC
jgi:uncharacterized protein YndB with AHSA1/START domain